jgi:hypothetical protein
MALTLHITPPNLIFHGRIGVTRVINTLEMGFTCAHTPLFYGSVAESYILSRVHFLFSIQLRFLDCWKIMRKDKSPSKWSFQDEQIQIPMEVQWHKSVGKQCKHLLLLEQWPNK